MSKIPAYMAALASVISPHSPDWPALIAMANSMRPPEWRRGKPNPPGTKLARKAAKGRISKATIR